MTKKIRIVHLVSDLNGGGIERLLYNYYFKLKDSFSYDFITLNKEEGILEGKLKEAGCNIYRIEGYDKLFEHSKQLYSILKGNNYDIIQDHSGYRAFINLFIAKQCGIKVRIAHCHTRQNNEKRKQRFFRFFYTILSKKTATCLFACGTEAGKWTWGNESFFLAPNAIMVSDFYYNKEKRERIRKELKIENKIVIGNIARLSEEKNVMYIFSIIKEKLSTNKNIVFIQIGTGDQENILKDFIIENNLSSNIIMLGARSNVNELINAFDLFVLPSKYEGIPVTLIEIQANGIPAIISNNITKEPILNDNIQCFPIDEKSIDKWGNYIYENKFTRCKENVTNSMYDLDVSSKMLRDKYLSLLNTI